MGSSFKYVLWCVPALLLVDSISGQTPAPRNQKAKPRQQATQKLPAKEHGEVKHEELKELLPLVNPGDATQATAYYNRIETPLNVVFIDEPGTPPATPRATTLDGLLKYLGYQNEAGDGLKAEDLETLDSALLMPRNATEFDALNNATSGRIGRHLTLDDFWDAAGAGRSKALVARFFAPKIATYFDAVDPFEPIDPDTIVPGWRKLVRLPPRSGIGGGAANLKYVFILFNFKKADPDANPFTLNESGNNQVILVPTRFDPTTEDAAYFAVYQKKTAGYPLGLFLGADFDLPGHAAYQASGNVATDSEYYVPTACAACHGHGDSRGEPDTTSNKFNLAKPNYLDTDQWYDWSDFDYRGVAGSLNDIVFDGGKDQTTARYRGAFNVIGAMNLGIKADTVSAEPSGPTFARRAVDRWLAIHEVDATTGEAANPSRKPYSARGLEDASHGGWNPDNPQEMRLLRLLDNHCFRCHSSMIYNVFDRQTVETLAPKMKILLNKVKLNAQGHPLPGFAMPQGRVLPSATRAELSRLLTDVLLTRKLRTLNDEVNLSIVASNYEYKISLDGGAAETNPTITVKQGATIAISIASAGGTHDWVLEDSSGRVVTRTARVSGGTPVTHLFTAGAPGDYLYFCSVGSHRELGMEGKLVIEP